MSGSAACSRRPPVEYVAPPAPKPVVVKPMPVEEPIPSKKLKQRGLLLISAS